MVHEIIFISKAWNLLLILSLLLERLGHLLAICLLEAKRLHALLSTLYSVI
jgi:hypothetical protein